VAAVTRGGRAPAGSGADVLPAASPLDLDAELVTGLDEILGLAHGDAGWIALSDGVAFELACRRGIVDELAAAVDGARADEGPAGEAFTTGRAVAWRAAASAAAPAAPDTGAALLALPLQTERGALGVAVAFGGVAAACAGERLAQVQAVCDRLAGRVEQAVRLREQLDHLALQQRLLAAVETVARSVESGSLETTILAEAARLLDAEQAVLLVLRGDVLVASDAYGLDERSARLFVVPLEDSLFGRAVLNGGTVAVDERDPIAAGALAGGGWRALLATPLQSCRGTYGALCVFSDRPRRYRHHETTVLRTFAAHAMIALDNRRLICEKDEMAVRDGLTGVYNRSYLELALARTTKEVRRSGGVASVLFLDLDGMKQVNDGYGHEAGDTLLRRLAGLLVESCRETDVVARYGGDEFVVLMPGTDSSGARRVAAKVDEALARHNETAAPAARLSASMGLHSAGGADIGGLLREADRRMYATKRSRRRG
jgi:diguanylate cyclase (GGDEF)-like protein